MTIDTRLLTRDELSTALKAAGFSFTPATLATLACRGCGPEPFARYGNKPLYSLPSAITWAKDRTAATRKSTFDAQTASQTLR